MRMQLVVERFCEASLTDRSFVGNDEDTMQERHDECRVLVSQQPPTGVLRALSCQHIHVDRIRSTANTLHFAIPPHELRPFGTLDVTRSDPLCVYMG